MSLKCDEVKITSFFRQYSTLNVPRYQRSYAWNVDDIENFCNDIKSCLDARRVGKSQHHFFGGLVSITKPTDSRFVEADIVDGQQRITTFVILATSIVSCINEYIVSKQELLKLDDVERLKVFSDDFKTNYMVFKDKFENQCDDQIKLVPTAVDLQFFEKLVLGKEREGVTSKTSSHRKLDKAFVEVRKFVFKEIFESKTDITSVIRDLTSIVDVLEIDCTVISITTEEVNNAYRYFQVLNARGEQLSTGDLLRARTLSLVKKEKRLEKVTAMWNEILTDSPAEVEKRLRWYYESITGQQPRKQNLFDQFMKNIFGKKVQSNIEYSESEIENCVQELRIGLATIKDLQNGVWNVKQSSDTYTWNRERLRSLILSLGHTKAIPLLLAVTALNNEEIFYETVAALERFFFRYKIVGNGHVGEMEKIYRNYCCILRDGRVKEKPFAIDEFRKVLRLKLDEAVSENIFRQKLEELKYLRSKPKRNEAIKVLFALLEHYGDWVRKGGIGIPVCEDKFNVIDVKKLSLEHIYPQNANKSELNVELEESKDCLGNLTGLSLGKNSSLGREPFIEKKKEFKKSNLRTNRTIAENKVWTIKEVKKRQTDIIEEAVKIFVP